MGFPHDKEPTKTPDKKAHHPPPSSSELLSSAKIVAGALRHDPNQKLDKTEVAAAAENILHAASHYGKLDEKGGAMGKMVDQAETYLHNYHSSQSSSAGNATAASAETHHESKPHKEEGHSSGGGYGEYIKMAEGLLNKNKHSGESGSGDGGAGGHSGSKYGDYAKMAGDFLKK